MDDLSTLLIQLSTLITHEGFQELESDTVELKPCPASTQDWSERYKSVNALLNSRGGLLILGIKESGQGAQRKYIFTGYNPEAEPKLAELRHIFTDSEKRPLDLTEYLPPPEIHPFLNGRIAIQRVEELPAQRKFALFKGTAYKRILTGDVAVKQPELDRHAEFIEEIAQARELAPLGAESVESIDLDRLNEYILQLNRLQKIESLKPSLAEAASFLERKRFIVDGKLTLLGALVCGAYPGDLLGFRAHVHGYVNVTATGSTAIAQDKQDMIANILPLLELANAYAMRNIQVGIAATQGGSATAQYPETVLRETINNALAHRDYAINKQVVIAIHPDKHIEISNPGRFRDQLLLNLPPNATQVAPLLRVVPETKPRNPRLADVLRVYRKWEGRGIGMSTLVNLSLEDKLNLPYFRFKSDEVTLVLQAGKLLDSRMKELFDSRDAYIQRKLGSFEEFSEEKRLVLAYLIKSEWANAEGKYCVLLTPDNNHAQAIKALEKSGLIARDTRSTDFYPVYVADRLLMSNDFEAELRSIFGNAFDEVPLASRKVLAVIYCYSNFSSRKLVSAKQASFTLWSHGHENQSDIHAFDKFYRSIRRTFNQLEAAGFIQRDKTEKGSGYVLANNLKNTQRLLF